MYVHVIRKNSYFCHEICCNITVLLNCFDKKVSLFNRLLLEVISLGL